jgi:ferredoxin-thioredoxin reductase catalytic subunit/rubredoxin
MADKISQKEIDLLYEKLKKDAEAAGYNLNPDVGFTKALVRGLIVNNERYGYQSCPCRLSVGDIEKDRDIICPCDYRDADLNDYGSCYCGLYVDEDIVKGKKEPKSIPERRSLQDSTVKSSKKVKDLSKLDLKLPVWRCRVCGYLCGRENPPNICPVCKAKKDRFERFF